MGVIRKIRSLNNNINKKCLEIERKKDEFKKEYNKWGKKREMVKEIP